MYTFINRPPADLRKGDARFSTAKANLSVVTKMFMNLTAKPDAEIQEFFKYEISRDPPALSNKGSLYSGSKSELIPLLPGMPNPSSDARTKSATAVIFDMAAVIHMLKPKRAATFGQFAPAHLIPFLQAHLTDKTTRLDGVWETYKKVGSIKTQTHQKRGATEGRRTRITADTPVPQGKKYEKFLADNNNKDELFKFLSAELIEKINMPSCNVLTTQREYVLSTQELDIDFLQPCDHEEADTRVFLHLKHAVLQGHKVVFIRTVDIDLVVFAISVFDSLKELGLSELYIRYGVGKQRRDIPIQDVCYQLGPRECQALGMFHANSGSDFSSFKRGIGKKTAWSAWKAMPEMTDAFIKATEMPGDFSMESPLMACFEKLTCREYSKTLDANQVNEARRELFTKVHRGLENIPPTKNALYQHVRRALYVAAFMYKRCMNKRMELPSPGDWGWEWNPRLLVWVPYWTDLEDASHGCHLLLSCGCQKGCTARCKCSKSGIRCGPLCKCEGSCSNNEM